MNSSRVKSSPSRDSSWSGRRRRNKNSPSLTSAPRSGPRDSEGSAEGKHESKQISHIRRCRQFFGTIHSTCAKVGLACAAQPSATCDARQFSGSGADGPACGGSHQLALVATACVASTGSGALSMGKGGNGKGYGHGRDHRHGCGHDCGCGPGSSIRCWMSLPATWSQACHCDGTGRGHARGHGHWP